jgi:MFS family permease
MVMRPCWFFTLVFLVAHSDQVDPVEGQSVCLLQLQATHGSVSTQLGADDEEDALSADAAGTVAELMQAKHDKDGTSLDFRSALGTLFAQIGIGVTSSEMITSAQRAIQDPDPKAFSDDTMLEDWVARGHTPFQDIVKYVSFATLVLLTIGVLWVYSQDPTTPQKPAEYYTTTALIQMQAFRWYAGFFIMVWLPYLIAQEGERMWGNQQAVFMSVCKLIFGLSIVTTPFIGALNDRTRLRFGRRRAWFFGGVVLIVSGICGTALSSIYYSSNSFFLFLTVWMLGEAVCESTAEALVPDLVATSDYTRAGSFKSAVFSLGGIFGYGTIIVCGFYLKLPFHWMYLAFLFCVVMTAPFVFSCAAPTESEVAMLEVESGGDDKTFLESLWQSYVFPLQGPESRNFLKAIVASAFYCAGASSVLFILLVCRDVIQVGSSAKVQLHFACVSLLFCAFAVLGSGLAEYAKDSATRLHYGKLVGFAYGVTELLIPACRFAPHPAIAFYLLSAVKGTLYGNITSMFMTLLWDCVPAKCKPETGHDHIADSMAVASVGRSFGAGLGNAICGLVLQFAFTAKASTTPNDASDFHYRLDAYYAMFSVSALNCFVASTLLQYVTLDKDGMPEVGKSK